MVVSNPFKTVPPAEWLKRTNVGAFAVRSGALKEIDKLYAMAHNEDLKLGRVTANTLQELMKQLTRYLQEHKASADWTGPDKKDLNRNKASGGLMKMLYDFVKASLGTQNTVPTHHTRHTRAGVVYLLGNLQVSMNMWSVAGSAVAVAGPVVSPRWKSQDVPGLMTIDDPAGKLKSALGAGAQYKQEKNTVADPRSLWDKICAAISGLADSIEKYFKFRTESFYTNMGQVIRMATDFVVKLLSSSSVIGAAMDVGQGFIKVCVAAANYMEQRRDRMKFLFLPGHPAILAQTLEDAMKSDISSAILQVFKGALSATLAAFTANIGPIILEAFGAVVSFISRYLEIKRIENFCAKAQQELDILRMRHYNFSNADANIGGHYGILDDADEFGEFYQKGANASVSIPILTLNSGICGDLMQMIQMYEPGNKIISKDSFKAGGNYFQRLKHWGSSHIQKSGIQYNSSTPYVRKLLNHAVYGHQGTQSTADKVLSVAAA